MDVEAKRMEKNALIDHLVAAQEIVRDTHADGILLDLISQAISRAQNEAKRPDDSSEEIIETAMFSSLIELREGVCPRGV